MLWYCFLWTNINSYSLLFAVSFGLLSNIWRKTTSTERWERQFGPAVLQVSSVKVSVVAYILSVCWSTGGELCHSQHYGQHWELYVWDKPWPLGCLLRAMGSGDTHCCCTVPYCSCYTVSQATRQTVYGLVLTGEIMNTCVCVCVCVHSVCVYLASYSLRTSIHGRQKNPWFQPFVHAWNFPEIWETVLFWYSSM